MGGRVVEVEVADAIGTGMGKRQGELRRLTIELDDGGLFFVLPDDCEGVCSAWNEDLCAGFGFAVFVESEEVVCELSDGGVGGIEPAIGEGDLKAVLISFFEAELDGNFSSMSAWEIPGGALVWIGEGGVIDPEEAQGIIFYFCAGLAVVATMAGDLVDVLMSGPIARAVVGEVGATFFLVEPADVHDHEAAVNGVLAARVKDAIFVELEDFGLMFPSIIGAAGDGVVLVIPMLVENEFTESYPSLSIVF